MASAFAFIGAARVSVPPGRMGKACKGLHRGIRKATICLVILCGAGRVAIRTGTQG